MHVWRCPFALPVCAHTLLFANLVWASLCASAGTVASPSSGRGKPLTHTCLHDMCLWAWETLLKISGIYHVTVIICKFPRQLHSDKIRFCVMQNTYSSIFLEILSWHIDSHHQAVLWNWWDCSCLWRASPTFYKVPSTLDFQLQQPTKDVLLHSLGL